MEPPDRDRTFCKMCSDSGEAEHDLDPETRYKRPPGRGPSGMVWNSKTGEWDEEDEDAKKPEIKKEKKAEEVVPVAKSRKPPAKRKAAEEDDYDYDDDDDDVQEVVPVSKRRASGAASSSMSLDEPTRSVPNDSPFGKGEIKPSSFDANYWYKRMKEQMKVTHTPPPPAVA